MTAPSPARFRLNIADPARRSVEPSTYGYVGRTGSRKEPWAAYAPDLSPLGACLNRKGAVDRVLTAARKIPQVKK